jgi:hypothetical protein
MVDYKFVERDVDMLLAEELRVNAAFGKSASSVFRNEAFHICYGFSASQTCVAELL